MMPLVNCARSSFIETSCVSAGKSWGKSFLRLKTRGEGVCVVESSGGGEQQQRRGRAQEADEGEGEKKRWLRPRAAGGRECKMPFLNVVEGDGSLMWWVGGGGWMRQFCRAWSCADDCDVILDDTLLLSCWTINCCCLRALIKAQSNPPRSPCSTATKRL